MGSKDISPREQRRVKDIIVIVVGLGLVWWTVELFKSTFGLGRAPKKPSPKGTEDWESQPRFQAYPTKFIKSSSANCSFKQRRIFRKVNGTGEMIVIQTWTLRMWEAGNIWSFRESNTLWSFQVCRCYVSGFPTMKWVWHVFFLDEIIQCSFPKRRYEVVAQSFPC